MAPVSFPDPASPEGQAWAAAGFPTDETGAPAVPAAPPPEPKDPPPAGALASYTYHDDYSQPPGPRTQVILVTGHDDDGRVRGFPLGHADQAASFDPGQLD